MISFTANQTSHSTSLEMLLWSDFTLCITDRTQVSKNELSMIFLPAQKWCISNGWELVELEPSSVEPEHSDEEDDFPESFGFKRIRQALHAHTWSNLTMKGACMWIQIYASFCIFYQVIFRVLKYCLNSLHHDNTKLYNPNFFSFSWKFTYYFSINFKDTNTMVVVQY